MPSHFRIELEKWLKTIDVKADRVLDVGGAQLPIKGRMKSWNVGEYKILDLEQPHEGRKPDLVADLNILGNPDWWSSFNFDVIFCLEVMEYIYNPFQAMKNINNLMAEKGILWISFPFLYPLHKPTGKDYLRYTKYGAEKLLEEAGFEILKNTPRQGNNRGTLLQYWNEDGFKADKSETRDAITHTGCMIRARKK